MGKNVRVCIRIAPRTGDYPVPTSELSYLTHNRLINEMCLLGGTLTSKGTWDQAPALDTSFARSMLDLATETKQQYTAFLNPGHGTDKAAIHTVLDDPALQQRAAAEMLTLAQTRFDAPWQRVIYDALHLEREYLDKQAQFLRLLSQVARDAGLSFGIAYPGIRPEEEAVRLSLDVIAEIADTFDCYFYGWWLAPCSTGPYWWAVRGIENALAHGIKPKSIYLGIAGYARYWPQADYSAAYDITHAQAMQIVRDSGATVEWVESHPTGLIREKYANVGKGRIWIQDGDTVRARLALVDEYKLGGAMLFIPGMEAESVWQAIAEWKRPAPVPRPSKRPQDFFSSVPIGVGEVRQHAIYS